MALREKLIERTKPFLEADEQVKAVFLAQTGPTPWLGGLGALIYAFIAKFRIVVVTDRSIVLLKAGALGGTKPKELVKRVPRTPLEPFSAKVWGKVMIDGERHWVHRRFKKDVDAVSSVTGA